MKTNEVPVFFAADDGYAPFLSVALNSLVKNASGSRNYRVIVLHEEMSEENRNRISALAKENVKIDFVPMQKGLETVTDRMSNRLRCDYFTLTIYFRLFIPAMFPEYDKAVYIDSDIVLPGDIAELYDIDIKDNYIAACTDFSIQEIPPLMNYVENAVGVKGTEYINSGVLLMNLKELRERNFDSHFLNLLNTYHFDSVAPDQDYINAMCNGKIHYLPECWDAMPNDNKPALEAPKLIHYNLFSKPWCYDNIQYEEYFWKYAEDCGFKDEIKRYKDSYSEEQKRSDSDCLNMLVGKGDEIPLKDITFKKMFEKGVKIRL